MKKTITCTVCPQGCEIEAEYTCDADIVVRGNSCPRGERYAKDECLAPKRTFTSSVRIDAPGRRMLPVRTSAPVAKEMLLPCAEAAHGIRVEGHVHVGDVIRKDFLGTGTDLVASMTL
ncbi:MAG: DUF1667 domain-containing protein [Kiritimatiellae bacterium]|nr:DUF1667 domain-containing protein [Kiritimatiellia bacterium]